MVNEDGENEGYVKVDRIFIISSKELGKILSSRGIKKG